MVLLLPLPQYDEGDVRPIEHVLTAEWRARGYNLAAELDAKDERRDNLTAIAMWARGYRLCPKGGHRHRMWPLYNLDAYTCRWGHTTPGRELRRPR